MECNKDEANRAKNIAEKKMQSRDFVSAKKLLLKALQLFPDIENVSQMLTVCEVHCSADSLINGQVDHYGVLQVEHLANDLAIRKQYHRLALLLHPDKNKFAGAEAAFKLVGDAYKVLSDKANRQVYDLKTRVQVRTVLVRQPSQNAKGCVGPASTLHNQFGGAKQQVQQATSAFFASQCFWTMCVFCNYRFQYSRTFLNRDLQCQRCFKKFHAFELSPVGMPRSGSTSAFSWSSTDHIHNNVPGQHFKNGSQTFFDIPATKVQENVARNSTATKPVKPAVASMHTNKPKNDSSSRGIGIVSSHDRSANTKDKPAVKPSSGSAQRRGNKRNVTSSTDSESAQTHSSDHTTHMESAYHHGGSTSSRYPRREARHQTNVIPEVDGIEDDDFVCPPKKLRKEGSYSTRELNTSCPVITTDVKAKTSETSIPREETKGDQAGFDPSKKQEKQVRTRPNDNSAVSKKSRSPEVKSSFTYPDPEFYDFEKDRHQSKFAANQIWAAYDTCDAMPRFYAIIKKVFTPDFKLQYTWLEYNPTSAIEKAWVNAGLPIACGNYKTGKTYVTRQEMMFSRLISCEQGKGKTYNIYPKKGEVWALFKNWDVNWCSAEAGPKEYEYDFVEVVSDFAYGQDISVSYLIKVKGFICLFVRAHDTEVIVVPCGHLLRFSHCVPYYRVCQQKGIPGEFLELDPAALPLSILQITDTVGAGTAEVVNVKFHDPSPNPGTDELKLNGADNNKGLNLSHNEVETSSRSKNSRLCQNTDNVWINHIRVRDNQHVGPEAHKSALNTRGEAMAHSERYTGNLNLKGDNENSVESCSNNQDSTTKFYNFQEDRSVEKFKVGQIWALYSDIDEYPNYYGWIKKLEWEGSCLTISVKWLEFLPETDKEKLLLWNDLPVSCGRFQVRGAVNHYDSTDAFSHLVHAKPIKKNVSYEIYPNCGEVWAIFKNWNVDVDCEKPRDYGVVEIVEQDKGVVKALSLTKVKGYKYVFMPDTGAVTDIKIPIDVCLIFSHQVPAFKITNQESGKLKDYWELDPDSIPKMLLSMDP